MSKPILGTHAAEMELLILKFALDRNRVDFSDLIKKFTVNPHTKRSYCHPKETWNHITDCRMASALDDLVRYDFLSGGSKLSNYKITENGIDFLRGNNLTTLGTRAAEMELKILKFAGHKHKDYFGHAALDEETKGNSQWTHVTAWRRAAVVDDLVRYSFLSYGKQLGTYIISESGLDYLRRNNEI